jgi:endonuclease/exonuclease/phosphatase (EEP) superfamily protein YafD
MKSKLKNSSRNLLVALQNLFDLYTGSVALWLLFWRFLGDANGWFALINAWAFWLFCTGIPTGAISIARRSRWLAGAWILGLGFWFGGRYHRQVRWISSPPTPCSSSTTQQDLLTVLSANLLNVPRDLSCSAEAILAQHADLVLFQEAIASHAQQLDCQLAGVYPHRCWVPYLITNMGLGVVSRFPFAVTGFWQDVGLEPYTLRIALVLPGGPLDVYCIHFISPSHQVRRYGLTALLRTREQQILTILEEIKRSDRPAIVAGDWNSTEGSDTYRWASAQLVDGWLEGGVGPGWSWPRILKGCDVHPATPLLRLDYLFHTGRTRHRVARVESMQRLIDARIGSDHCPLLAHVSVEAKQS